MVDEGESVEQGLNRELEEEINLNLDEVKITESDLISIQRPTVNDEDPNLVCYFYAKGMPVPGQVRNHRRVRWELLLTPLLQK